MFKDFDAMLNAATGRPTFTIGGEKFTARAKLPWKKFTGLLDAMTSDDAAAAGTAATEKFLAMSVIRADRQRFIDLLNIGADGDDESDDDEAGISPAQVNELSMWLMEHYTGKQSEKDESSSAGPATTGRTRKVVSLSSRKAASA